VVVAGRGQVQHGAAHLGGHARHVEEHVDGERDVAGAGDGHGLAVVQALDLGQLVRVRLHEVRQAPEQLAAGGRLHARPLAAAKRPASAARSTSAASASATSAICWLVAGSKTTKRLPDLASTYSLPISRRRGLAMKSAASAPIPCVTEMSMVVPPVYRYAQESIARDGEAAKRDCGGRPGLRGAGRPAWLAAAPARRRPRPRHAVPASGKAGRPPRRMAAARRRRRPRRRAGRR